MKNKTRYLISNLATRLGVAGFYSSLHWKAPTVPMESQNSAPQAQVESAAHNGKAAAMVQGNGIWRGRTGDFIELRFPSAVTLNTAIFRERGSHCRRFSLKKPVMVNGSEVWETFYESDKIERLRFCVFPNETLTRLRFCLEQTMGHVTLTGFSLFHEPKKQLEKPFRVSGYLPQTAETLLHLDEDEERGLSGYFDTVNEVMLFSSFCWSKEGKLYFNREHNDFSNEADQALWLQGIDKLKEIIGTREVKLIPTCWNPGADTVYSLTHHMDALVTSLTDFIIRHDFYGIDFDWEFPKGKKEWALYGEFLIKVKERLRPHGKILSVCFADWGVKLPLEAVRAIDTMSYMAYDIIDLNGYHSSFGRAAVRAVEYGLRLGFTLEQLNLGIPFYARPTYTGEYWPLWKDEKMHSYWQNYDPNLTFDGIQMDGYYNSPGMVRDKTAWALQMGLGGVMVFSLECDKPSGNPLCLTDALGQTLRQRIE